MKIYLDAVGGVAGDMFAAAILDAWPELEIPLGEAFREIGLDALVDIRREDHDDGVLTGSRFVTAPARPQAHAHRDYRSIVEWLERAPLGASARAGAQGIFRLLGEAEAEVHGIALEDVTFHEVGAWDSIADVVAAAWLVDAIGAAEWHAAPLPMGRGRVTTAHGRLPVPAPATTLLLEDYPLVQDELEGERITPTGAAILRYLAPRFEPMGSAGRVAGTGIGFGNRTWPGISNVLRVIRFAGEDARPAGTRTETVGVCTFVVDDQSGEDLAVGLDRMRAIPGVLDIVQMPCIGKKGRLASRVEVLAAPERLTAVAAAALAQTSTLGVRRRLETRDVLAREADTASIDGRPVRVKRSLRPDGSTTIKAEMDDLAGSPDGYAGRTRLRRAAEDPDRPEAADE